MMVSKKNYKYVVLLGSYFFVLLIIFLRPLDVQEYQWADDALYFNNASSISNNIGSEDWLGPFSDIVISKAPFFSVFLSLIHCIGLPLRFAEFLIFAPLPWVIWISVRPLQGGKWPIVFLAVLCVVCIPVAGFDSRLLRTTLFGALSIYFLTTLCGFVIRSLTGTGKMWLWAIGAGLSLGLASITREEASWLILPAISTIFLSSFNAWNSEKFYGFVLAVGLLIISCFLPISLISTLNYKSYGLYSVSLRQSTPFRDLFATLCSLQPNERQRYVPINTNTRKLAYSVSPHFVQLMPYLEGAVADDLARNKGHLALNGWATDGREFFVSNFEFALAKAIFLAGYQTGPSFISFCQKVTDEIQCAADKGLIEQGSLGFSMLPPLSFDDAEQIIAASLRSFWLLVSGQGFYRKHLLDSGSISNKAVEWHSYLMTWPYPQKTTSYDYLVIKNRIYNYFLVLLGLIYPLVLLAGVVAGVKTCLNIGHNCLPILFVLCVGWSAIIAFCFSMGVVHTIAFPSLMYPQGYNRMGFFPLHFLLFVSAFSVLLSFKGRNVHKGKA